METGWVKSRKPSKRSRRPFPKADGLQWLGLCDCGCGSYYVAVTDKEGRELAVFGWDREGWRQFMAGVIQAIEHEEEGGHSSELH
jgi:hypothetical protein